MNNNIIYGTDRRNYMERGSKMKLCDPWIFGSKVIRNHAELSIIYRGRHSCVVAISVSKNMLCVSILLRLICL